MKNKFVIFLFIISFIVSVLLGFFISIHLKNNLKKKENRYIEIAEKIIENSNKKDVNSEIITNEELQINNNVIGILEIPKIEIKAPVREGTTQETLKDSIGHLKNSSLWNGNVGLAAHNRGNYVSHYFERLDELVVGDLIIYKTKFGERRYEVEKIINIESTDWSELSQTEENSLTLITCIKNKPNLRLCVKAIKK